MKVLVTGASGFVGRAIIGELLTNKFEVYGLTHQNAELEEFDKVKKVYQGDVGNYKNLFELEDIGQVNVVVHSAGLAHQFGKKNGR